jgi:hypothetical protein
MTAQANTRYLGTTARLIRFPGTVFFARELATFLLVAMGVIASYR